MRGLVDSATLFWLRGTSFLSLDTHRLLYLLIWLRESPLSSRSSTGSRSGMAALPPPRPGWTGFCLGSKAVLTNTSFLRLRKIIRTLRFGDELYGRRGFRC